MLARDPENLERRLVVPAKSNIAADRFGYAFTIEEVFMTASNSALLASIWEPEPVSVTLDGLVQTEGTHRRHERERVKAFLRSCARRWPAPNRW